MRKIFSLLFIAIFINCFSQDGSLDPTFDGDGILISPMGSNTDYGSDVALQSDGKIVVCGSSYDGAKYVVAVARYNADGSLDNTFDSDGKFTLNIPGSDFSYSYSVAIQTDGKILVSGYCFFSATTFQDFFVIRLNSNGTLDNTFDSDGIVTIDIGTSSTDLSPTIILQNDGKIIQVGATDSDFAIVRYNTNGSLDNTFGTNGVVVTDVSGSGQSDYPGAVALQSDGKIICGGHTYPSGGFTESVLSLVRYNTDGSLDNTFDSDGKVFTDFQVSGVDPCTDLALQSDGKIIACGYSKKSGNQDVIVARYNVDGSLDNTFDVDGKLILAVGTEDESGNGVVIQQDGKIVIGGYTTTDSNYDFLLLRYNVDGTLDNTFDADGIVITDTGNLNESGSEVVLQADGKILLCGSSSSANYDFALLRYNGCSTPSQPITISGNNSTCSSSIETYSVTNDASATSYTWILPSGWTGSSTTNSITATSSSTSGNITVTANNACGSSTAQTLNVTVNMPSSSTINETSCDTYTAPDGTVYTTSGTKIAVIPNAAGCDSTITINLTINNSADLNLTVTQNGNSLEVAESGASYLWYSCLDTTWALDGDQIYTPINNGSYFVFVTKNACTSSSECFDFSTIGIDEKDKSDFNLYPNPTSGKVIISNEKLIIKTIEVYNLLGEMIFQSTINNKLTTFDLSTQPNGIYFINCKTDNETHVVRIIKQ